VNGLYHLDRQRTSPIDDFRRPAFTADDRREILLPEAVLLQVEFDCRNGVGRQNRPPLVFVSGNENGENLDFVVLRCAWPGIPKRLNAGERGVMVGLGSDRLDRQGNS